MEEIRLQPASMSSVNERAQFIQKTYFHVALAVLGFILTEFVFMNIPVIVNAGLWFMGGSQWLLLLGGFMFATSWVERKAQKTTDIKTQYGMLILYVVIEAFIFVPLLYIAMYYSGSTSLISQAGLLTLFLFSGLTAIALLSGKDFSFLRKAITIGGFLAIGLIAAGMLFGFNLGLWFSFAMVGLAAASILYQTSNIMHHYATTQYVAASLGLFASLMLLFWYILSILSSFSGD